MKKKRVTMLAGKEIQTGDDIAANVDESIFDILKEEEDDSNTA